MQQIKNNPWVFPSVFRRLLLFCCCIIFVMVIPARNLIKKISPASEANSLEMIVLLLLKKEMDWGEEDTRVISRKFIIKFFIASGQLELHSGFSWQSPFRLV